MKNRIISRKRDAGAIIGRTLLGVAAVGAAVVLIRSLPDLVRYLRIERM
jgi:hypothetical protein